MIFEKLASAIKNDLISGLQGYHSNLSLSLEQLQDDIVDERLQIIKEYALKGILPIKDLLLTINCIPVNCQDSINCEKCSNIKLEDKQLHFEIPQILTEYGVNSISYLGSVDKKLPFRYYTTSNNFELYNKYRKRKNNKPYVLIQTSPNANGLYDCYVYNAPLLKAVSITAIFKDPRQLENFDCCVENKDDNFSFINNEIKKRLTSKKIQYYRQFATGVSPNDQKYS